LPAAAPAFRDQPPSRRWRVAVPGGGTEGSAGAVWLDVSGRWSGRATDWGPRHAASRTGRAQRSARRDLPEPPSIVPMVGASKIPRKPGRGRDARAPTWKDRPGPGQRPFSQYGSSGKAQASATARPGRGTNGRESRAVVVWKYCDAQPKLRRGAPTRTARPGGPRCPGGSGLSPPPQLPAGLATDRGFPFFRWPYSKRMQRSSGHLRFGPRFGAKFEG